MKHIQTFIAAALSAIFLSPYITYAGEIPPTLQSNPNHAIVSHEISTHETAAQTNKVTENTAVVDINSADLDMLTTLNGIGAKKAQAIIAYRTANGKFKNISELLSVKGISQKLLDRNHDRLSVG